MTESPLSLLVDGLEIPAVLTVPATAARAALLFIPGSLNSDVDGNFAPMFPGQPAMAPHASKDLAQQLAACGVTVLRYAKSGPGTGSVSRDPELVKQRFQVFSQRLRVAQAFFAELSARAPGLPLAAAGHSEGAVVATQLARTRADLRALVLLSGPAKPLLRLMIGQQFERDPSNPAAYAHALTMADDFVAGRALSLDPAANPYAGMVPFFFQPQNTTYLRSLEQVDPAAELASVAQPVLIVQGGRDESVRESNAELLRQAQPAATVARFPELNHFYKRAPLGLPPQDSMALDGDSDPAVAGCIAAWLGEVLSR